MRVYVARSPAFLVLSIQHEIVSDHVNNELYPILEAHVPISHLGAPQLLWCRNQAGARLHYRADGPAPREVVSEASSSRGGGDQSQLV